MNTADLVTELEHWFRANERRWREASVRAELHLSSDPEIVKAAVTLETTSHVASITVWGHCMMMEFIVMDVAKQQDPVVVLDKECPGARQLRELLERCADEFAALQ